MLLYELCRIWFFSFKTYKKNNADKFVYYILNGDRKNENSLYSDLEFITIIQDEQTIEELKPQKVTFEISSQTYSGKTTNRYLNIRSC